MWTRNGRELQASWKHLALKLPPACAYQSNLLPISKLKQSCTWVCFPERVSCRADFSLSCLDTGTMLLNCCSSKLLLRKHENDPQEMLSLALSTKLWTILTFRQHSSRFGQKMCLLWWLEPRKSQLILRPKRWNQLWQESTQCFTLKNSNSPNRTWPRASVMIPFCKQSAKICSLQLSAQVPPKVNLLSTRNHWRNRLHSSRLMCVK